MYPEIPRRFDTGEPRIARDPKLRGMKRRSEQAADPSIVRERAEAAVRRAGGNVADRKHVLGQHILQWGMYQVNFPLFESQ